ncbi:MAG: NADPH-dependent FMN reductase [Bacteroidetes bacterium]|nr:MAG: NADPH-dependent FMN reductase [Bacteroidota bacterium]
MKKILAFAGSNSSTSINHTLVSFVASQINDHDVKVIRLSDYPLLMYGEDLEKNEGFPSQLEELLNEIKSADGLIISVNEHNSGVSAFFKNVVDWLSRIDRNYSEGKKILVMSTSPGKRGGMSALDYIKGVLPRTGGEVVDAFSFPSFYENFSRESDTIENAELSATVTKAIQIFLREL